MSRQPTKINKYGKKSTFSREKSYANSEFDIAKNDKKADEYRNERRAEREHNLKIANPSNGIDDKKVSDDRDMGMDNRECVFYYEKMNFVINNLPMTCDSHSIRPFNLDALIKEFEPYGKIQYITCSGGMNIAKIVVDQWYDDADIDMTFITDIQGAIFDVGKYEWTGNATGKINITKDPDQRIGEMGDKIIVE